MESKMSLVLRDPTGTFWEGALVSEEKGRELAGAGADTIPVVPELFKRNGVAGFFRRAWGAGWPLGQAPERICPAVLMIVPGYRTVHWRVRLRRVPGGRDASDGQVRIVTDAAQRLTSATGFVATDNAAVKLSSLGPPDDDGGWTISGSVENAVLDSEQYLPLTVYGHGPGWRVEWLALSQT